MEKFIMPTEDSSLSGRMKAAILLSEMDAKTYKMLMDKMKLNPKQMKDLMSAMEVLGSTYNPTDERQVKRENKVLTEALEYGCMKGIFSPTKLAYITDEERLIKSGQKQDPRVENIRNMLNSNSDGIANILANWINND